MWYYLAFLGGAAVGASVFSTFRSATAAVSAATWRCAGRSCKREPVLVVIWSGLVSMGAFLFVLLPNGLIAAHGLLLVERVSLCVVITSIPVSAFVLLLPSSRWESARGIVAGTALRFGLAFALFMRP